MEVNLKEVIKDVLEGKGELNRLIDDLLPEKTSRSGIGESDLTNLLLLAVLKKLNGIEERLGIDG